MNKRRVEDYLFCIIVGALYIYAVNLSLITSTVIQIPAWILFFSGLALLLVFMLVFFNRITMIAAAVLLIMAALFVWLTAENWVKQFEYVKDLFLLARGYLAYRDEYGQAVMWLICTATALLTVLFLFKRFNFYVLAFGGATTFAVSWIMDYRRNDIAFLIFLLCFCLLLVKKMNRSSLTALLALPICLFAVWSADHMPGQDAASAGQSLSRAFDAPLSAVNELFYLAFNPKYFSFQTTGFNRSDENMGGPVAINTRAVMSVTSDSRTYLSGAVKNTYTGRSWTDELQAGDLPIPSGEINTEYLETAAALIRQTSYLRRSFGETDDFEMLREMFPEEDQPYLSKRMFPYVFTPEAQYIYSYLPMSQLRISIGGNRTGSVFHPAKPAEIHFLGGSNPDAVDWSVSPTGNIRTAELMEKDMTYAYRFLNPDRKLTFMKVLLNASHRGLYREMTEGFPVDLSERLSFVQAVKAYRYNDGDETENWTAERFVSAIYTFTAGRLVDYADGVYTHYTALPDTVPERVYTLAADIVKDCETDYERAKALENYLVQFPYTLTPSPIPDEADFVDYFLFEGREGYCTYYASALAVMSRCVGIPSRFVEGYLLPSSRESDGTYHVTNRQAHAWAEVYLEGYGWLTLEATAPYNYASENRPIPSTSGLFTSDFQNGSQYEDYLRQFGFDERAIRSPGLQPVVEPVTIMKRPVVVGTIRVLVFLFLLAVFLLMLFGLQMLREALRYRKIARMDTNRQAQAYFKGILKMTTYYHYPYHTGETPRAYGNRLGKRFAFKSDTVFLRDLIALYYKAKYGNRLLTDQELNLMKSCYFDMILFLRSVRILPRYIYLRYIRRVTLL